MAEDIRIGILGLSPGNGHPYSWSAIVNGYDPQAMAACPFPAIPRYLAAHRFPEEAVQGARVTHVWTQDRAISEAIAAAALIPTVVDRPETMIGAIDAVILARDDAATRDQLAGPFLDAGLPVFIDKPLAGRVSDARRLFARQRRPGQLFTASAARWWFALSEEQRSALGPVHYADATVFNDWDAYAVHAIEPLLLLLGPEGEPDSLRSFRNGFMRGLTVRWPGGPTATITAHGTPEVPLRLRFFGPGGMVELSGMDNFTAFKRGIEAFLSVVRGKGVPPSEDFVLRVIQLVEAGSGARGNAP